MPNIYYEARYNNESAPRIYKVVDLDSDGSEEICTAITLQNSEELESVSTDIIWAHMANMVEHLKKLTNETNLVAPGVYPKDGWPVIGWQQIGSLNEEINQWWYFVNRRDPEDGHTH